LRKFSRDLGGKVSISRAEWQGLIHGAADFT